MLRHVAQCLVRRASTAGLLVLLLNSLCFSCYLVMMQHRLRARPFPFTLFAAASMVGSVIVTAAATRDFGRVRPSQCRRPGTLWNN